MTSSLPSARSAAPPPTPADRAGTGRAPSDTGDLRGPNQPHPSSLLARIGAWCFDHRKAAVGIWFAALIVVFGAAGAIGAAYDASPDVPDSESADGFDVLERYFPELGAGGASGTIVFRADQGIDDPAVTAAMEELFATVNAGFPDDGRRRRSTPAPPWSPPTPSRAESQIARQGPLAGQLAYAQVNLTADVGLTESAALGEAIADARARHRRPRGPPRRHGPRRVRTAEDRVHRPRLRRHRADPRLRLGARHGPADRRRPRRRRRRASGLIVILSNVFNIPDFTTFLGAMIGLGVGIDYALFIVTRYREGLHAGRSPRAGDRSPRWTPPGGP